MDRQTDGWLDIHRYTHTYAFVQEALTSDDDDGNRGNVMSGGSLTMVAAGWYYW